MQASEVFIITQSFNQIRSIMQALLLLLFFWTVSETALISSHSIILNAKECKGVHAELLYRHTEFHPDHLKSVQGNEEANRFCIALTL